MVRPIRYIYDLFNVFPSTGHYLSRTRYGIGTKQSRFFNYNHYPLFSKVLTEAYVWDILFLDSVVYRILHSLEGEILQCMRGGSWKGGVSIKQVSLLSSAPESGIYKLSGKLKRRSFNG